MEGSDITLRDILQEESRELNAFGEKVEAAFFQVSERLSRGFARGLDDLLSGDFKRFRQDIRRSLAGIGTDLLSPVIQSGAAAIGGEAFGESFGRVGTSVLGNVLRTGNGNVLSVIRQVAGGGDIFGDRAQSRGQTAAQLQTFLQSAWRNL